jgi:hypothetical protein
MCTANQIPRGATRKQANFLAVSFGTPINLEIEASRL